MLNVKFVFFLFFLFFAKFSYGQFLTKISEYYDLVNQAEMEIVENNFHEALIIYEEAFKLKDNPFERDLFNYSICLAKLNYKKKCVKSLNKILEYGFKLDSLLNYSEFHFLHEKKWKRKIIQPKNGVDFIKEIDSLLEIDQKFRKIDKIKFNDTIVKIDNLNAFFLKKYIQNKGCLTEKLIGQNEVHLGVLLIHNFQGVVKGEITTSLYDLLRDCVFKGEIDIRKFAFYIQGYNNDKLGAQFAGYCKFSYLYFENNESRESDFSKIGIKLLDNPDEINIGRKKYGLCSYEDYINKLKYQFKNKVFKFSGTEKISYLCFSNKEIYEEVIKGFIFLE